MNLLSKCSATALCALGALPAPLLAQDGNAGTSSGAENRASGTGGDIIVTALRREQLLQDVPVSINAFSDERLEEAFARDITDLQNLAAGLQVGTVGSEALVTLRGIGNNSAIAGTTPTIGSNSGVAIFVDGTYLSSRFDQSQPLYDLQRVEVLRGPQSSLYGRNATGGAINYVTKSPTADVAAGIKATLGNYDLIDVEGYANAPLFGDSVRARIAFRSINRDGFLPNISAGADLDDASIFSIRGQLAITLSDDAELTLGADLTKDKSTTSYLTSRGVLNSPTRAEVLGASILSGRQVDRNDPADPEQRVYGLHGELKWDLDFADLTLRSEYRDGLFRSNGSRDGDGSTAVAITDGDRSGSFNQFSQNLLLVSRPQRFEWVIGAEYFDEESEIYNPYFLYLFNFGGLIDVEAASKGYSLFAEGTYHLTDNFEIIAGGRFDYEKKKAKLANGTRVKDSFSSFSPRVVAMYRVSDDVSLYGGVSTGFKSGGFNAESDQLTSFDPETVVSYEVGLKSSLFDNALRLNANFFYMDYKDLQVIVTIDVNGLPVSETRNAASSKVKGVELELDAKVSPFLKFDGNIAYLDATYGDLLAPDGTRGNQSFQVRGNRLTNAPKWAGVIGATFSQDVGEGEVRLRGEYSFKSRVYFRSFNDEVAKQDSFGLLNASLTYDSGGPWSVTAFGKNLTNELVVGFGSISGPLLGFQYNRYLMAPRTYGVRFSYDF